MKVPLTVAEISVTYSSNIPIEHRICVTTSSNASEIFRSIWDIETIEFREEFYVLYLNRANHLLGYYRLSIGSVNGTVVDIKHLFGIALKANASCMILAHNHPSGNLKPSHSDIEITKKAQKAATFLELKLLDHLIITPTAGYYSFADEGLL